MDAPTFALDGFDRPLIARVYTDTRDVHVARWNGVVWGLLAPSPDVPASLGITNAATPQLAVSGDDRIFLVWDGDTPSGHSVYVGEWSETEKAWVGLRGSASPDTVDLASIDGQWPGVTVVGQRLYVLWEETVETGKVEIRIYQLPL
ncbi:MAG: hypothetical protein IPK13_16005 [Deltaproteobacteria bacterium]|nr:hypothetical protein [Deltaproteobacteria bacterium]